MSLNPFSFINFEWRRDILFGDKYTELVLSNGNSYILLGHYEKVLKEIFIEPVEFLSIDKGFINVSHIVEVKEYKEV